MWYFWFVTIKLYGIFCHWTAEQTFESTVDCFPICTSNSLYTAPNAGLITYLKAKTKLFRFWYLLSHSWLPVNLICSETENASVAPLLLSVLVSLLNHQQVAFVIILFYFILFFLFYYFFLCISHYILLAWDRNKNHRIRTPVAGYKITAVCLCFISFVAQSMSSFWCTLCGCAQLFIVCDFYVCSRRTLIKLQYLGPPSCSWIARAWHS